MINVLFFVLLLTAKIGLCLEFKGVNFLVNLMNGGPMLNKLKDDSIGTEVRQVKGRTIFDFIGFVTYEDRRMCSSSDNFTGSDCSENNYAINAPIKIKCLKKMGNGTVHVVGSVKEVSSILMPPGNYSKKHTEGTCAVVLFYATSCPGSALVAPHFNALARQFPEIKIAAVDSLKFHSFNTEFGVVGLPTIMLFHQGRPVVKFNDTSSSVNNFVKFVTKHTGIRPKIAAAFVTSDDFTGPLSSKLEREPDTYLCLSWVFIIICGAYYFTKSKTFVQLEEMAKRNWRESEAQLEENS